MKFNFTANLVELLLLLLFSSVFAIKLNALQLQALLSEHPKVNCSVGS